MNPKIKELAEQCREEYPDTEWPDATRYRFDEAKFAELIVRECLSYTKDGDIDFMKFMIKKHFGVEE